MVLLVVVVALTAYIVPIALEPGPDYLGWGTPTVHQPPRPKEQLFSADLLAAWQHDNRAGDDTTVHRWFRAELSTRWRAGLLLAIDRRDGDDRHQTLGQADATYRFAQGHGWAFSTGLGTRWRRDETGGASGVDYFYGVETWPIAPVVVRGQLGLGKLGGDSVVDAWVHLGVGWRHGEVFVGERYLRIGMQSSSGPLLGAGVHW